MQIVIDIPDELCKTIKSDEYGVHQGRIYDMIRNGTPLSEIRAEMKQQKHCRCLDGDDLDIYREGLDDAIEILDINKDAEYDTGE